jgi:hypothetical protein
MSCRSRAATFSKVSALPIFRRVCHPTWGLFDNGRWDVMLWIPLLRSIDPSCIPLIVPIDRLAACGLILCTSSRYREDAISIIAVVDASKSRPHPTASTSHVTASLSRYISWMGCIRTDRVASMNWCGLALLANVGTDSMTKRAVGSSLFDADETCAWTLVEFHSHHLVQLNGWRRTPQGWLSLGRTRHPGLCV